MLSWLILRGRCRHCKARISPRYLAVELLTGALFLLCCLNFGFTLAALKYCAFGFLVATDTSGNQTTSAPVVINK